MALCLCEKLTLLGIFVPFNFKSLVGVFKGIRRWLANPCWGNNVWFLGLGLLMTKSRGVLFFSIRFVRTCTVFLNFPVILKKTATTRSTRNELTFFVGAQKWRLWRSNCFFFFESSNQLGQNRKKTCGVMERNVEP